MPGPATGTNLREPQAKLINVWTFAAPSGWWSWTLLLLFVFVLDFGFGCSPRRRAMPSRLDEYLPRQAKGQQRPDQVANGVTHRTGLPRRLSLRRGRVIGKAHPLGGSRRGEWERAEHGRLANFGTQGTAGPRAELFNVLERLPRRPQRLVAFIRQACIPIRLGTWASGNG